MGKGAIYGCEISVGSDEVSRLDLSSLGVLGNASAG